MADLKTAWQWYVNPYQVLDNYHEQFGLTFRLSLPILGNPLITGDPRLIRKIKLDNHFHGGKGITALRPILGERSLIMLTGEEHRARRALIAPHLRHPYLEQYDRYIQQVTREELDKLQPGKLFSAYQLTKNIGLRVIVRVLFNIQDQVQEYHLQQLVEDFLNVFDSALMLFVRPFQVNLGRFSPWGRMLRRRNELAAFIINQMDTATTNPDSLLGKMVMTSRLSNEDIVNELLALLLFGHDTGAATMAWAIAHILQDDKITERVREEVTRSHTWDDLTFMQACIYESMRLSPVVVHLTRVADQDMQLMEKEIHAGDVVVPCTYLAQHNPTVFGKPHCFEPNHFLNGVTYPNSYFPFGFGERTCIGMPFVLRQMKIILATLFEHTHLRLAPGYKSTPTREMVLMIPRHGTLLTKNP